MNHKKDKIVAFFCMEYALDDHSESYAGGLGILAGDYLLESAHQEFPIIAFGLRYGSSTTGLEDISMMVEVPIGSEIIKAKVWQKNIGNSVRLIFLDTDIPENSRNNRFITRNLYDSDFETKIKQQIILGIGGIAVLNNLKIKPEVYHLNEGHTAFAALAIRAEDPENLKKDIGKIVATKHTIFSNAGSLIPKVFFESLLHKYCNLLGLNIQEIFKMGQFELNEDMFSTTKFLLNSAHIGNGVSALHTVYEKKVHPQSKLIPITNGVNKKRWQAAEFLDSWKLSDEELLRLKDLTRERLISFVENHVGDSLDPHACTIVWARRFAAYKRPFLLFEDLDSLDRLAKIVSDKNKPIQFVFSGKAHPGDSLGRETIEKIISITKQSTFKNKITYIPGYSITIAKYLVEGADVWLNTPEKGKEACGTSGIKASLNGALQCSVSDGWVDEVDWSDKGWILSEDHTKEDLYRYLENDIPGVIGSTEWVGRMRKTIDTVEKSYTTERMLKDYISEIYKF